MPTTDHDVEDIEKMYILRDQGCTNQVIRLFGLGRRNKRGRMLINFHRRQHSLVVMNVWLKERKQSCTLGRAQENGNVTKSILSL